MDEVRLAFRRLTNRPGATIAAVATLAVSIGAAAATWSLLSALLLNPLPVRDAGRLVVLGTPTSRTPGTLYDAFIYPVYPHVRDSAALDGVAAAWAPMNLLVGTGERRAPAAVGFATHELFDLLGVSLATGRGFTPEDDRRGAPLVAILSDHYWRRAFDGAPDVVGRSWTIAGKPVVIVGVAARGFRGLDLSRPADVFLPLHTIAQVGGPFVNYFADAGHGSSPTMGVKIVGRLRDGETAAQVGARLSSLPPLPGRKAPEQIGMTPISAAAIPAAARAGMRQFARLLAATVGLLLLIGCATVGTLLLVRTEARREEFAMCLALGATRRRLARGIAAEGALLAAAGAGLALPVTVWLFSIVRAFQLPGGVNLELLDLRLDSRVLAAAAAAAVLATIVVTLIAGVFGFAADTGDALRSRAGATPRIARRRTRAVLVAAQVAVALVLVAGAGVFVRSLRAALSLNPGFETSHIVNVNVSLGQYQYSPSRAMAFFDELRGRLTGNPAIRTVSFTASQGAFGGANLIVDGTPRLVSSVSFVAVDRMYFDALGTRVLEGRDFSARDVASAPLVATVSASFARFLGDGGSAIGRRLTMPYRRPPAPAPVAEVVGVVPDVITSVTSLEPMVLYLPLEQASPGVSRTLVLRATSDAGAAKREALGAIKEIDRAVTPGPMLTIDERLTRQMAPQHFGAVVLAALGGIAVLLTILGTYVLSESLATLRMREMGVRAALGATRRHLAGIVLAETGRLVGAGLLLGLGLAWLGASTIRALLFRVQPLDPATLAGVAGLILLLSLIVSVRPALRAARVDLASVLREQ